MCGGSWFRRLPRRGARPDRRGRQGRHPQDTPWQEHRLLDGHPPTGRDVAIEVIDVVRVAGGQVVEHWNVADQLGWMRQLGVIE